MKIFKNQASHLLFLILSFFLILYLYDKNRLSFDGDFLNIKTNIWFVIAILSPVIHQIYVLICWRSELYYKYLSKTLGKKAFSVYKAGFSFLILSRLVTIILLSISNKNTLELNSVYSYTISFVLLLPVIYLFYSVYKYFGADRAYGYDHFFPEEARKMPFVKKGIFKYTSNAMYVFGFFILWIPGILLKSESAVFVALFSHIYIQIHYYFTELPDIKEIYGQNKL